MNIRSLIVIAIYAALVVDARALDDYPNRPITMIVPFSPGSAADNSMRPFTRVLSQKLGQTVVIDNKPGAGGILGMEIGAAAKPDGYTLIFGSSGPMATFTSLYKNLSFDPAKSFIAIRAAASNPYVMVFNPAKPYKTLAEFIDYAKKHPNTINYGSVGNGSSGHLGGELLQQLTGIKMTHVPYKVSATQIGDLLSGVLDVGFEFPSGVKAHIESGKLAAIAMASDARMKNFPSVPTFAELGYPDMKIAAWSSLLVPAGTPLPIVEKLDAAIAETIRGPVMTDYYAIGDSVVLDVDHKQFPDFLAKETARLKMLVERSGATAD
ncbi:tripartite tricarboxylate transporter substrate binding protein [Bradyrhizobium sp. LHD-71]|uniref:Bug family tripartite tricarboxylate transporter substrate binding protein n=1 Tax=Bradyrhizobium sp. LHD-71 TaxID=3072141 RepID=UPI00280FD43C|nr:tripartite tricarboxylate transporter substrate binding protein [Bradyrhizobium sp. LHD-71]MDQ8729944.1 tripartite tricarboxylate transporter substrate binding protein [Bradyrhizobium sp. LHD-71]